MNTCFCIRPIAPNRADYVTSLGYTEDMQAFLLGNVAFRVTGMVAPAMAREWHRSFGDLVKSGYMRRSRSGRYVWNNLVCHVSPAGPGCVSWTVKDSTKGTWDRPLASGDVRYPVQCTPHEMDEAWAEAEKRANSARQRLEERRPA